MREEKKEGYVGADIGGTKMLIFAEYQGSIFEKKVSTGKASTKEYLRKEILEFIDNLPFTPKGLAIAIPGLVEESNKVVASDVIPCLNGISSGFFRYNEESKVIFINDARAGLVSQIEEESKDETVIVIMVGTGIGMGIYEKGTIISGSRGCAGEIGFCPFSIGTDEIKTLDELSSGASILQKAGIDAEEIHRKGEKEDEIKKIINDAGYYFGIALANVINLFNPNKIILGGSTVTYPGYMKKAMESAKKLALKESFEQCEIRISEDPKHMVVRGAMIFLDENLPNKQ